jgi:hypothetical protein
MECWAVHAECWLLSNQEWHTKWPTILLFIIPTWCYRKDLLLISLIISRFTTIITWTSQLWQFCFVDIQMLLLHAHRLQDVLVKNQNQLQSCRSLVTCYGATSHQLWLQLAFMVVWTQSESIFICKRVCTAQHWPVNSLLYIPQHWHLHLLPKLDSLG